MHALPKQSSCWASSSKRKETMTLSASEPMSASFCEVQATSYSLTTICLSQQEIKEKCPTRGPPAARSCQRQQSNSTEQHWKLLRRGWQWSSRRAVRHHHLERTLAWSEVRSSSSSAIQTSLPWQSPYIPLHGCDTLVWEEPRWSSNITCCYFIFYFL